MGGNALNIGYFGEQGSFSEAAARSRFGESAFNYKPCSTTEDAFDDLQVDCNAIVVPIEYASSGMIVDTVDQLIQRGNQKMVVSECLAMKVKLVLLGDDSPVYIYSHNAALTHAKSWLREQYPQAAIIPTPSTSIAAQQVFENRKKLGVRIAALGSREAARVYGLDIVRDDVQTAVANRTKFYVIGRQGIELPDKKDATHTALIFEAAHRPGSLVAALKVLSDLGLNLTMIQSRPIPGRFDEYRFFIEFEGVPGTEKGDAALAGLKAATHSLNLLGSYPIVNLS